MITTIVHFFRQLKGLDPYWLVPITFAFSVVTGLIVRFLFINFLKVYGHKTGSKVVKSLHRHLGGRTRIFFPLMIFYIMQPFVHLQDDTSDLVLFKVTQVLVIVAFGWVLLRLTRVLEDVVGEHFEESETNIFKARKIQTQIQFVRRILSVVIFILVLAAVLLSIPGVRSLGTTLLTSAGVAGIIIGIAAQKSLANLLAGMQIAITQPIKINDAVIVEGEWGNIEEITLTYVVVKIWDKRRMILPINYFIEKPFQNWTRTTSELLGPILLYVDYTLPVEALRAELDRILESESLWDGITRGIQVTDTTEKVMIIRVLVSAADASKAWDLRCSVREKLVKFIQENYPEALPQNRVSLLESKAASPLSENRNLQLKG